MNILIKKFLSRRYSVLRSHHYFWAAPASEVQGPGVHSGSNQIGSAPARSENKAAPAPYTKILSSERLIINTCLFLDHIYRYLINCFKVMFDTGKRLFCSA